MPGRGQYIARVAGNGDELRLGEHLDQLGEMEDVFRRLFAHRLKGFAAGLLMQCQQDGGRGQELDIIRQRDGIAAGMLEDLLVLAVDDLGPVDHHLLQRHSQMVQEQSFAPAAHVRVAVANLLQPGRAGAGGAADEEKLRFG